MDQLVLGAYSVIDLSGELISKPVNREDAMKILKKLSQRMFVWGLCQICS